MLRSGWWLGPILGGAEVWGYHPKEDRSPGSDGFSSGGFQGCGVGWGGKGFQAGKSQKTVKSVLFHV